MDNIALDDNMERVISQHSEAQWERRDAELAAWAEREKLKKKDKLTVMLESVAVDAELHPALALLRRMQIPTEFSCAGVSVQDDPLEHSLYAYITFHASEQTEEFVRFAALFMKHRLLVTFEPSRARYDLSSFFIGHNRSFCLLMQRCAEAYQQYVNR
ncbi:hypothetical protein BK133_00505 [Paenibacillus sp. FSL H8-0548]|uniref:hypothetical protein n=1 Tax=Paenibacillus sp. FSL H8-0548 TaxID=1920422 RepID=UPI00096C4D2A|nr:hypothetical protein [Paenibacillus sp. FSL H8-0548]OMF38724.1 hypothetical protein BK133_00505 [Paenibacillus sp. FSL H8-0548]